MADVSSIIRCVARWHAGTMPQCLNHSGRPGGRELAWPARIAWPSGPREQQGIL